MNQDPSLIQAVASPGKRTMRPLIVLTTKMVRRTTTIPHILVKTCLLEPDAGPCRGNISMWYFDPANKTCSAFYWGGCQGNGNRFDKLSDCMGTCLSGPEFKDDKPRYCNLAFDYGWCFGADERYYYDRVWGTCKKTIYSGCGGNKNNFYSKETCDQVCRLGTFSFDVNTNKDDRMKKIVIINPNEYARHPPSSTDEPVSPGDEPTSPGDVPNSQNGGQVPSSPTASEWKIHNN
ncbi:hypothetical protein O0L34_g17433 [Tuta absoluta]|nr:hypothetical protein O0L34_g17433 [Tuta absoluta]